MVNSDIGIGARRPVAPRPGRAAGPMARQTPQGLICLAAIVLLDWATFSPALAPLGVTPWNPSIGLAVATVLIGGPRLAPLLALAPLVNDLFVRNLPFEGWVAPLEAVLVGCGYWLGLYCLNAERWGFDRRLRRLRDLLLLGACIAVSALVVALAYTGVLAAAGYLERSNLIDAVARYWVGDMLGIMVMTPFLLLVADRRGLPTLSLSTVVQSLVFLAVVLGIVGLASQSKQQFSFLLVLPILWLALRFGFEGAAAGLVLMQVSIMLLLHLSGSGLADLTMFQAVMVMLAVSGLAVGVLVSERAETERRLREQQDALARAARLSSMGEFAASMAHEINQPLTAAGNYARAIASSLKRETPRVDDARMAAERLVEQVDRSAQVIRRLRALIREGRLEATPERVDRLLDECADLVRPLADGAGVKLDVDVAPNLPLVGIDRIQIQQVITNLLRNAIEALAEERTAGAAIRLSAARTAGTDVTVTVADNGPGFPPDFRIGDTWALGSSKPDGLGLGLSLCQSIIAAHGGRLAIGSHGRGAHAGATISFTLPLTRESGHAAG